METSRNQKRIQKQNIIVNKNLIISNTKVLLAKLCVCIVCNNIYLTNLIKNIKY